MDKIESGRWPKIKQLLFDPANQRMIIMMMYKSTLLTEITSDGTDFDPSDRIILSNNF